MKYRILLVDGQVSFCQQFKTILNDKGHDVCISHNPDDALEKLSGQSFDILLSDMRMPGMDGLALFLSARKIDSEIAGIIMTSNGSISMAVNAIKQGVSDYIQKPIEPEVLLMMIEKALQERQRTREIRHLRKALVQGFSYGKIIGKNHRMREVFHLIEKVAPSDSRVFITGETGVGKELVARAIHFNSPRKNKAFVGINCGVLSESLLETELFGHEKGAFTGADRCKQGKFEYARGGTLFLDEIGDISPALQVKLLRVTQENSMERVGGNSPIDVNVRIVSATNQDIMGKIKSGSFRMELFYRLNVVAIQIPPLRERIDDIPLLVHHFIHCLNRKFHKNIQRVSTRAMKQLMQHNWPGNIRELANILERAFVTTDGAVIDSIDFSNDFRKSTGQQALYPVDTDIPFKTAMAMVQQQFEKAYLLKVLQQCNGNVSRSAEIMELNPRTLWRKIKDYRIDRLECILAGNRY
ncbi:sigma-54-dependent transcriptional regulator [Desulfosalsimonas propionicica]|nr:sigma-54 dependent transcriptional regulator [Desulfosalsimonas propionicica]